MSESDRQNIYLIGHPQDVIAYTPSGVMAEGWKLASHRNAETVRDFTHAMVLLKPEELHPDNEEKLREKLQAALDTAREKRVDSDLKQLLNDQKVKALLPSLVELLGREKVLSIAQNHHYHRPLLEDTVAMIRDTSVPAEKVVQRLHDEVFAYQQDMGAGKVLELGWSQMESAFYPHIYKARLQPQRQEADREAAIRVTAAILMGERPEQGRDIPQIFLDAAEEAVRGHGSEKKHEQHFYAGMAGMNRAYNALLDSRQEEMDADIAAMRKWAERTAFQSSGFSEDIAQKAADIIGKAKDSTTENLLEIVRQDKGMQVIISRDAALNAFIPYHADHRLHEESVMMGGHYQHVANRVAAVEGRIDSTLLEELLHKGLHMLYGDVTAQPFLAGTEDLRLDVLRAALVSDTEGEKRQKLVQGLTMAAYSDQQYAAEVPVKLLVVAEHQGWQRAGEIAPAMAHFVRHVIGRDAEAFLDGQALQPMGENAALTLLKNPVYGLSENIREMGI